MNTTPRRVAAIAACVSILLLVSASQVFAAASSQTIHQPFVQTSADVNQCSGAPVTQTISGDTVLHITSRPNDTVSMTSATTGTLTLVPDEDGQPTYSGRFTDLFSGYGYVNTETDEIDARTVTSVHNVILHGTDGSLILVHGVAHETINPDQTVSITFDHPTYICP